MTRKGFPLDWRLAIQNAVPLDPLGPSIWTNEPMGRIFSDPYLAASDTMRAERAMEPDQQEPGRAQAGRECAQEVRGATDRQVEALRHPPGQRRLLAAWREGLRAATADLGTMSDYDECIARQDIPLLGGAAPTVEAFYWAIRKQAPAAGDKPTHDRPDGRPTWRHFLALESQWLVADWTCRANRYEDAMARVPAFTAGFAADHADQVATLQAAWVKTRARARAMGWTPQEH